MSVGGLHAISLLGSAPVEGTAQPERGVAVDDPAGASQNDGVSFGDLLASSIGEATALGQAADARSELVARGALDDLHGTMISAKEAEISLKLVGSVRNKLLDAFQELWRTSV